MQSRQEETPLFVHAARKQGSRYGREREGERERDREWETQKTRVPM